METLTISNDVELLGRQVTTFPVGIPEVFDSLMSELPNGNERANYGLSWLTSDGQIVYIAAMEQKKEDDPAQFGCTRYLIEKGTYLSVELKNWMQHIDSIKSIFQDMMEDPRVDIGKPCIEWYKSDEEMACMMKLREK